MSGETAVTINNRYILSNRMGKGGMGAVYRAFDRLNRHAVALKQVLTDLDAGSGSTDTVADARVSLANEFQTLATLHHPNIIRVLDYGFDSDRQPYFTMSLLEGATPLTDYAVGKSTEAKVNLILQTLQALSYLHRRGILHRDLKPDNALVMPDGTVKVLDFGLATEQTNVDDGEIVGTLTYMAPEVLQGSPANRESDLYSLGVMAYELFAGSHPFAAGSFAEQIQLIFFKDADVSSLQINADLAAIIKKLLVKEPDKRYNDAIKLMEDITYAADVPMPEETAAIRESFLKAARFVGREQEMSQLQQALAKAVNGHGSTWLIGGESGVGKSRLIEELRTRAMVRGTLVVSGQAVADGGLTYQLWRDPIRRLLLSANMDDQEAGILKQLVPDMSELLGRPIADAPEVDGKSGLERLLETIGVLFRHQEQPILLILEDLQWAIDSLDILRTLIPMTAELPLMIVGTYRDEERADLPDLLAGATTIHLQRFDDVGIETLAKSMLGAIGERKNLLELIKRETEGNVFFLVEVIRTLAEEAGRMSDIGTITLPERIIAGGVQEVLLRRLTQLPEDAKPLVMLAAVAGRQIDLALLRQLDPTVDVEKWLTICSNLAIVDVVNEQWRFAHEKLRESIIAQMPADVIRDNHIAVAKGLETIYRDNVQDYAGIISEHYEDANDLESAAYWHVRAGRAAHTSYASAIATQHYSRAVELWDQGVPPRFESDMNRLRVLDGLGKMLNWQARYVEAQPVFERMLAEAVDNPIAQADAQHGLATGFFSRGEIKSAFAAATESETIARKADAKQALVSALWLKGWSALYSGKIHDAQQIGEEVLILAKEIDARLDLSQGLNLLGAVYYGLGDFRRAIDNFERALTIQVELGQESQAMASLSNIGYLRTAVGDYEIAIENVTEALEIASKLGHRQAQIIYNGNLGAALVRLEKYKDALAVLEPNIREADRLNMTELSELLRFSAEAYLNLGDQMIAFSVAQRALVLGYERQNPEYIGACWRVVGQVVAQSEDESVVLYLPDGDSEETAATCFSKSEQICRENGVMGELARTLKEWALYCVMIGEYEEALAKWQESRTIFEQVGAVTEAQRMEGNPW